MPEVLNVEEWETADSIFRNKKVNRSCQLL